MDVSRYTPPKSTDWQGREDDAQLERLHQLVKLVDWSNLPSLTFPENTIAFIGFSCDEGVKRNHGRQGAKDGPDALRHALSNYPLHDKALERSYIDLGNVIGVPNELAKSQAALGALINDAIEKNCFPIVLGGGHETAWGHYQGLAPSLKEESFAIVNFDAHFDMRPVLKDGEGSSGTAFLQIAHERDKQHLPFNYYCLGIQKSANTQSLFQTAKNRDVHYITCDEIYDFPHQADKFIREVIKKHHKNISHHLLRCLFF